MINDLAAVPAQSGIDDARHRFLPRGLCRDSPPPVLPVHNRGRSRYVYILGVTANPDGRWTVQQIRNLLTHPGDRAADFRFPARDRAGPFTEAPGAVLAGAGSEAVTIPPRSPRARTPTRNGSCSPPGPRSPARCSSSANGICGRSWPSTRPAATAGALIAAGSSARPGPATLPRTSPRTGSGAGLSSAASSMSTSGPHRGPGQNRRPSSGTPQPASRSQIAFMRGA